MERALELERETMRVKDALMYVHRFETNALLFNVRKTSGVSFFGHLNVIQLSMIS